MVYFIDTIALVFGIIFYSLTAIVFLLRAYERSNKELQLKYIFSIQIIPFTILALVNYIQNQVRHTITLIPIIAFLGYDYWYRVSSEKKPQHHPEKWPRELVIYLMLLFTGSIGLNWYGFLVSELYGMILVAAFFIMIGSYSFYQYRHNKRKEM